MAACSSRLRSIFQPPEEMETLVIALHLGPLDPNPVPACGGQVGPKEAAC